MAWTVEQERAITAKNKNLLVAAAAGSGKTAVLVERIIRHVLDDGIDIDRMLVVTFTNAAAEEMRQRIAAALLRASQEKPNDERIARQLILLGNASISTIHAFCQSVLRRNFSQVDIDPKFRLADVQEIELMKQDIMEELFESEYAKADEVFLEFVAEYGNERGDEKLHNIIFDLFEFVQSQPNPKECLFGLADKFSAGSLQDIEKSVWLEELFLLAEKNLLLAFALNERASNQAADIGDTAYQPAFEADRSLLEEIFRIVKDRNYEKLRLKFPVKFVRLPGKGFVGTEEEKQDIQALREEMRKSVKKIGEYFSQSIEDMVADLTDVEPIIKCICRLTDDFADRFAQIKKDRAIVDFDDLEHFAFNILCDGRENDRYLPSAAAMALREKFAEVMVDEYQDTNPLQNAILTLVMREKAPSSFVVGDVKQSIYGFRMADSEIFQKKYYTYNRLGENYERILLSKNFRSRAEVLEGINFIFRQLMVKEEVELDYDDDAALYPAADFAETDKRCLSPEIEIDLIDSDRGQAELTGDEEREKGEDLKGFELEAKHIASRVKNLVRKENGEPSGIFVFDKEVPGNYRQICWRDIAILMRSVTKRGNILLEAFNDAGIPACAPDDSGYFQEMEIKVMLALLSIIDNSKQDIPLAAVLHSPIGGFSAAELSEIRLSSPDSDLCTALLAANSPESQLTGRLRTKIKVFLEQLSKWRDLAKTISVPELLWQLYHDTGYYEHAGSMPGGGQRQANLRMLIDRAEAYEKTNFRGLFRFLRFVERMNENESDLAIAATLSENENVVRIITIHKSKGLEFPVVILANTDKPFNMQDLKNDMLIDRHLGLGPYCIPEEGLRYPSVARQAVEESIRRANKAEEMRVLYVALTRAKEKLILTGSVKGLEKRTRKWCSQTGNMSATLPTYEISAANSYLDWVAMAVARHPDGEVLRSFAGNVSEYVLPQIDDNSHWRVEIIPAYDVKIEKPEKSSEDVALQQIKNKEKLSETPEQEKIKHILDWQYDYKGVQEVPSKLSVTEMKKRFGSTEEKVAEIVPQEYFFRRPDFIQKQGTLSATEYGTLLHTVMQHIDYRGASNFQEIARQLEEMVEKEIILAEQCKLVNVKSVLHFFQSPLGQRLRKAKRVWRELPFSRMIQANRFYPSVKDDEVCIFSQGIVDLLFEEEDGLVLVDYKTDADTDEGKIISKYSLQLQLYAEAVENLTGKRVKEKYLYLLKNGKIIGGTSLEFDYK